MRSFVRAALGIAVTLVITAPAAAAVMVATFTGTVGTMTQNSAGLFAGPGSSLTGDGFTAVYVFDSDDFGVVTTPTSLDVKGGLCCLNPAPISSASLTINGVTQEIGHHPGFEAYDSEIRYDAAAGTVFFQSGRNDDIDSNLIFHMTGPGVPLSLGAAFSLTQDGGNSVFRWADISVGTDRAQLVPRSLTVVRTVPEPATWAMMLTGFFGLGAVLRRQRSALA